MLILCVENFNNNYNYNVQTASWEAAMLDSWLQTFILHLPLGIENGLESSTYAHLDLLLIDSANLKHMIGN